MSSIITLIAKPLTDEHLKIALDAIGSCENVNWLAPDEACDIFVSDKTNSLIGKRVRTALSNYPVDILQQNAGPYRKKRLLIADMDSTVITVECIDEMADTMGLKKLVASITKKAMTGELGFEDALKERAELLAGFRLEAMESVYRDRITISPGARTLVLTMKAFGAFTALATGGFSFFSKRVREAVGFHIDQANELILEGDCLSGKVKEPILGSTAKSSLLVSLTRQLGLKACETLAVGDGANDLPMIKLAGLGVAYKAKPLVTAATETCIKHSDLTALLYVQGYKRENFTI